MATLPPPAGIKESSEKFSLSLAEGMLERHGTFDLLMDMPFLDTPDAHRNHWSDPNKR